jgi:hypothetical protein
MRARSGRSRNAPLYRGTPPLRQRSAAVFHIRLKVSRRHFRQRGWAPHTCVFADAAAQAVHRSLDLDACSMLSRRAA